MSRKTGSLTILISSKSSIRANKAGELTSEPISPHKPKSTEPPSHPGGQILPSSARGGNPLSQMEVYLKQAKEAFACSG